MLRRLLFSVLAILFPSHPFFQIQMMVAHSIMIIIYIASVKPFENPLLNRLEIFNEVCIISATYHLFFFPEYTDDPEFQYQLGWSIIGVTTLNIAVNMVIMGKGTARMVKLAYRKYLYKFREWRIRRRLAYLANQPR